MHSKHAAKPQLPSPAGNMPKRHLLYCFMPRAHVEAAIIIYNPVIGINNRIKKSHKQSAIVTI